MKMSKARIFMLLFLSIYLSLMFAVPASADDCSTPEDCLDTGRVGGIINGTIAVVIGLATGAVVRTAVQSTQRASQEQALTDEAAISTLSGEDFFEREDLCDEIERRFFENRDLWKDVLRDLKSLEEKKEASESEKAEAQQALDEALAGDESGTFLSLKREDIPGYGEQLFALGRKIRSAKVEVARGELEVKEVRAKLEVFKNQLVVSGGALAIYMVIKLGIAAIIALIAVVISRLRAIAATFSALATDLSTATVLSYFGPRMLYYAHLAGWSEQTTGVFVKAIGALNAALRAMMAGLLALLAYFIEATFQGISRGWAVLKEAVKNPLKTITSYIDQSADTAEAALAQSKKVLEMMESALAQHQPRHRRLLNLDSQLRRLEETLERMQDEEAALKNSEETYREEALYYKEALVFECGRTKFRNYDPN